MDIGFLKRYKAAGSEGSYPSILEDGGEVLSLKVTKLLRSFWVKEQTPADWHGSMIISTNR